MNDIPRGKRKFVCPPMQCVVCGFTFQPFTRKAEYCSNACKQYAYRRSLKEKVELVETINHGSNFKHFDAVDWMNNYLRDQKKHSLLDISQEEFLLFPVEVQTIYQEDWEKEHLHFYNNEKE